VKFSCCWKTLKVEIAKSTAAMANTAHPSFSLAICFIILAKILNLKIKTFKLN
jgi:hypothetical protein